MSIVNENSLNELKRLRNKAKDDSSYQCGYRIAMEALSAAIAQLDQLSTITADMKVVVLNKE